MKKKVSFGPNNTVYTINKIGTIQVPLLSRPTRNMFPPGPNGNLRYFNAALKWSGRQRPVPKPKSPANARAMEKALENAIKKAENLNRAIKKNNEKAAEYARFLNQLTRETKELANFFGVGGNKNNNLYK